MESADQFDEGIRHFVFVASYNHTYTTHGRHVMGPLPNVEMRWK